MKLYSNMFWWRSGKFTSVIWLLFYWASTNFTS